jgi:GNAT superfamily N-acetyltransferase
MSPYVNSQSGEGRRAVLAREGTDPESGRVIGVGALHPVENTSDVAEVFLFVVPDRRGAGLGRRLFHDLVELARTTPARRLRIRLPGRDVEAMGLMSRLSTHVTMLPEDGDNVRIEFPTAAAV